MSEILTYYAVFALSGGIVCTWSLFRPSMYILEDNYPNNKVLRHKSIAGTSFFVISTLMAPFMIACLYYEDHFINTFVNNLLKIDSKNTS